jgi:hypothetical protein
VTPGRRLAAVVALLAPSLAAAADSADQSTVISAEQASRVPTGRSYQSLAEEVAGVVDVGGGGNPQIKGGNLTMNRYLVDGLEITDPLTHTFGANVHFDSLASIEVLTAGMEAQYNALGGVINLVTLAGGDALHVAASVYIDPPALSAGSRDRAPGVLGPRPFATLPPPEPENYQANLAVGGPLIAHKLWYDAALEYDYGGGAASRRYDGFIGRVKLTYAPSDRHRLTVSASTDPVSEKHRDRGGAFASARWDYVRSQQLQTSVLVGFVFDRLDFDADDSDRPRHLDLDDRSVWFQSSDIERDRRYRVQFEPSISLRGTLFGHHEAKIGLQSQLLSHTLQFARPGQSAYDDAGGGPGAGGLCVEASGAGCFRRRDAAAFDSRQWGLGAGIYVQDRWQPYPRLTIVPGLRFDWGVTQNSVGQTVSNLFGVAPRLGAVWDLAGDGRTLFTLFYGRSNETLSLLPAAYADPSGAVTTLRWNAADNRFEPLVTAGGPDGYRVDPHATAPHADELGIGVRRELFARSIASVRYTYKRISNIWDGVEINQIWNPAGTNVVGYVDGMAQKTFRYTTPDGNYRIYQGIDFVFESRLSKQLDLYAAYTLSWLYGPGADELGQIGGGEAGHSQYYNPRQAPFYDGFLPEDVRHLFKLRASYCWRGLIVGALLRYQSGSPSPRLFFNGYDGDFTDRRAAPDREPRTADTVELDGRVGYDFHELLTHDGRHHLVVIADLFSLFTRGGPAWPGQEPSRFQMGLRYTY